MKKIKLAKGEFALVDDEDFGYLSQWKWYADSMGYAVRSIVGKKISIHRWLMSPDKDKQVDHINGDKLDNRRSNLRVCTASQNQHNRRKHKDASSKYKGVTLHRGMDMWQAQLRSNGYTIYLGLFDTQEAAARAYNEKALEVFGKFSYLNQI